MGPTASGKTRIALELARHYPVELISVDSALVYRGLNIGSGKPDAETLREIPHHLVDIRDPADPYSAADFRHDALAAIRDICDRGRIPLLVGGTMLYFKVLRDGLADMPEADEEVRQAILEEAAKKGWPALHARLAEIDPQSAQRIRPTDSQRLQRALEVYEVSGRTMTQFHEKQLHEAARQDSPLPVKLLFTAIYPEARATLHKRIELRLRQMLQEGFVEEVKVLYQRGDLNPALPAIRSVGYRQVWSYLAGEYDEDTMFNRALAATRQLAKRQLTWLRSWPDLHVLDSEDPVLLENFLKFLPTVPIKRA